MRAKTFSDLVGKAKVGSITIVEEAGGYGGLDGGFAGAALAADISGLAAGDGDGGFEAGDLR